MWEDIGTALGDADLTERLRERQGLLAPCAVLLPRAEVARIEEAVSALHAALASPAVARAALEIARGEDLPDFGLEGWILGFDFHLTAEGPRLIEINTNPGGLLAVDAQARALAARRPDLGDAPRVEDAVLAAFRDEWRARRGDVPLRRMAIIDDDPANQYLEPEFHLYRRLFEREGMAAEVMDPSRFDRARVDMVYNRLVDFGLDSPAHAALAEAWRSGRTVVTPDPRAHCLYSDKRVLALLSDEAALRALGLPRQVTEVVGRVVPATIVVSAEKAADLWAGRRQWFFKPAKGHAGKAAYRGAKMTASAWPTVLAAPYVAQDFVPAARLHLDHLDASLKIDLRANVWRGRVIQLAARLYEGQTTNFRTPGGGFAAVFPA
jgi:hypothetical protein